MPATGTTECKKQRLGSPVDQSILVGKYLIGLIAQSQFIGMTGKIIEKFVVFCKGLQAGQSVFARQNTHM